MDHAGIARQLVADYSGAGPAPHLQLGEAVVHALLNLGEAIDAQTAELREVRGAINAQTDHRTGVH